ncbi:MAG: beta-lactamase family protein [Ilumatobacter sp.]|nr:beta-lactamase family protein [Ilumatobacter sp.]
MSALHHVADWPVDHAAAAIVSDAGVDQIGDPDRTYRLASLTKPMAAWAILVAVEEGVIDLDAPLHHVEAAEGATMRHLLSHAAGFGFDGDEPVAPIERRRMYSNTGIERAAAELAGAASMTFDEYFREALLEPLVLTSTELVGSPAHGARSTLADMIRFVAEMRRPTLLAPETAAEAIRPQFPDLAGIVPDVGRFDPCPWGLGVEVRGDKSPHWTGRANSPATFGHFGGAGTMMWVDPLADVAVVALTDRPFTEWRDDALVRWPAFSDEALIEARGGR